MAEWLRDLQLEWVGFSHTVVWENYIEVDQNLHNKVELLSSFVSLILIKLNSFLSAQVSFWNVIRHDANHNVPNRIY